MRSIQEHLPLDTVNDQSSHSSEEHPEQVSPSHILIYIYSLIHYTAQIYTDTSTYFRVYVVNKQVSTLSLM